MTYNVFGGTLSLTQSINQSTTFFDCSCTCIYQFIYCIVYCCLLVSLPCVVLFGLIATRLNKHYYYYYYISHQLFDGKSALPEKILAIRLCLLITATAVSVLQ